MFYFYTPSVFKIVKLLSVNNVKQLYREFFTYGNENQIWTTFSDLIMLLFSKHVGYVYYNHL